MKWRAFWRGIGAILNPAPPKRFRSLRYIPTDAEAFESDRRAVEGDLRRAFDTLEAEYWEGRDDPEEF